MAENYQTNSPLPVDSMRILEAKILNVLGTQTGTGGGGGGTGTTTLPQSYAAAGGTNPTGILTPRGATDYAINTTDGSIYWYYSGSWNP